jgi:hypothetical protein
MNITLQLPNAQDKLYLIKLSEFMRIVDREDLEARESESIKNAYHKYWFVEGENGIHAFHAPEFYLLNGIANFINGRHRTVLLNRHLDVMPMALSSMDGYPVSEDQPSEKSVEALKRISIREIEKNEVFKFPELPIKYLGYDLNIGK